MGKMNKELEMFAWKISSTLKTIDIEICVSQKTESTQISKGDKHKAGVKVKSMHTPHLRLLHLYE